MVFLRSQTCTYAGRQEVLLVSFTFVLFSLYAYIDRSSSCAGGLFAVDMCCLVSISSVMFLLYSCIYRSPTPACGLFAVDRKYLCPVSLSCFLYTAVSTGPHHMHVACLLLTGSTCGALYLCHVSCLHLGPQHMQVACLPLTGSTSGRWVAMMKACRSGVEKTMSCHSRYAALR